MRKTTVSHNYIDMLITFKFVYIFTVCHLILLDSADDKGIRFTACNKLTEYRILIFARDY